MNFRIRGLEARQFDHLFALSDAELAAHDAVRRIADGPSALPPIADIRQRDRDVRFVPKADITTCFTR
jgi:hypothetical protein